uniref:Uncharacterized protein n=1 Tax=Glossina palpalis gambiensis TaxID=67801 RepID=A0A1B0ASD8_9MUSC
MALADGRHFVWKMASTALIFCYLEFVLWFAILRPEIYVDVTCDLLLVTGSKFYGACIVPWIITFTHNWFENVFEWIINYDKKKIYDAENFTSSIVRLIVYMLEQLLRLLLARVM